MIERTVHTVHTNSDLTEGRGREFVKHYCELEATARRLAKGGYVQGTDCPVHTARLFQHDGAWYGQSVHVEPPTKEDLKRQETFDARDVVLQKALAAGITMDEIKLLTKGAFRDPK